MREIEKACDNFKPLLISLVGDEVRKETAVFKTVINELTEEQKVTKADILRIQKVTRREKSDLESRIAELEESNRTLESKVKEKSEMHRVLVIDLKRSHKTLLDRFKAEKAELEESNNYLEKTVEAVEAKRKALALTYLEERQKAFDKKLHLEGKVTKITKKSASQTKMYSTLNKKYKELKSSQNTTPEAVKNIVNEVVVDTATAVKEIYISAFNECKIGKGTRRSIDESANKFLKGHKFPVYYIKDNKVVKGDK